MKVNGWTLYWHPDFKEQFNKVLDAVEAIKANRPQDLPTSDKAKLLKHIVEIVSVEIPKDPNHENYAQGNTLGTTNRHWRRAKFFQRFRLFFRFSSKAKIIIYAWVNDEKTLRQAGAKTDPYTVFAKRLAKGDPPNDWDDLLAASIEIESVPKSLEEEEDDDDDDDDDDENKDTS